MKKRQHWQHRDCIYMKCHENPWFAQVDKKLFDVDEDLSSFLFSVFISPLFVDISEKILEN